MGYHCVLTYCSLCMVQFFCFVFELSKYHKISQTQNDIAVHISQIKRKSAENFFLKRAREYFFVSGPSN